MNDQQLCDKLAEDLNYDPETGDFFWKVTRGKAKKGALAGFSCDQGRRKIQLRGTRYMAHRLAFLAMTGRWPIGEVDHINGDQSDNRWKNLREASRSENECNKKPKANNTSGHKGVRKVGNRWRVELQANGKKKHLGYFSTFDEASRARDDAARRAHGEFFR